MEAVIAVVALLFVLFVVLGVYATVKVVGAAKRGVDRTITQARRTVEDTTLRAKTFAQPGPAGRAGPAAAEAAHVDAGHPGRAARGRGRGRVPQGVPGPLRAAQRARPRAGRASSSGWSREPDRATLAERLPDAAGAHRADHAVRRLAALGGPRPGAAASRTTTWTR